MNIEITSLGIEDIKNIRSYISDTLKNPMAAEQLIKKFRQTILLLAENPLIGKSLKSKIQQGTSFRFFTCDNYLIFYVPENTKIVIHRIIYGRRNYARLFFDSEIKKDEEKD
ncbi:MAG: type II toxin-antitoxin system RelE/ParE family toxin [Firmicutes bacterium]|nr:type II toxin-antitoxin system RelE/ParE family toxin [[Eubacterium] siraeum]MCM1487612.1 type II toxin-antitoxin system RelE/ParE family toxin [Bacillota bacterium]